MADELVKLHGKLAQKQDVRTPLTVGALYRRLQAKFPEADGEGWDMYGLVVGDADAEVERVAVALDATLSNIIRASETGANVLFTHHPVFLEPPERISPAGQCSGEGAVLWEAITRGIAIMSFHTALDAQSAATAILPDMLSLEAGEVFKPLGADESKGFGRVCTPHADDSLTLGTLASRCTSIFGVHPRVWGDFAHPISHVVTWAGSLGHAVDDADLSRIDAVVCGEVKYHEALRLAEAGVGVIELGHDVSEMPYALLLAGALQDCGVDSAAIQILDRGPHWSYPEAIRM